MSNRVVYGLAVAGLVLFSWTLIGQDSSNLRQSPGSASRYTVTAISGGAIMCDAVTGQTWHLLPAQEGIPESVWIPVKRLDSPEAYQKWKQQIQDGFKNQRSYNAP